MSRNLLGGFLGGVLGILLFGLIHWALLPVGCLLGVVLGYWHRQIWAEVWEGNQRHIASLKRFGHDVVNVPLEYLKRFTKRLVPRIPVGDMLVRLSLYAALVALFLLWVLDFGAGLVQKIVYWPFAKTENGIYIINATAALLVVGTILGVFWVPLAIQLSYSAGPAKVAEVSCFLIIGSFIILSLPVTFAVCRVFENPGVPGKQISRDLVAYNRHGFAHLFGYKVAVSVLAFVFSVVLVITAVLYGVFGIASVVGFMAIPISIARCFLRALWKYGTMSNHWPCLLMTLAVTTISAIVFQDNLHGVLLWLIALGTGTVAGLMTELSRLAAKWITSSAPRAIAWARQTVNDPFDDMLVPLWNKHWSWLSPYFFDWNPVAAN